MTVAPLRWAARTTRLGTTFAGRVGSMRGTTVVIPSAGPNRANSGNVARLTSPGPQPVEVAHEVGLGEQPLRVVLDALGRAGAAAREQDRRRRAREARRGDELPPARPVALEAAQRRGAGHRDRARGDREAGGRGPAQHAAGEVGLRGADERLGSGLGEAAADLGHADARVDDDRDGPHPQQGVGEHEEVGDRRDEQRGPGARADPGGEQAGGRGVDPGLERAVVDGAGAGPHGRGQDEGGVVGMRGGVVGEQPVEGRRGRAGGALSHRGPPPGGRAPAGRSGRRRPRARSGRRPRSGAPRRPASAPRGGRGCPRRTPGP